VQLISCTSSDFIMSVVPAKLAAISMQMILL
jgi:hypothetical protein